MGNLCALMAHATPGDEVLLDPESHIFYYEQGSMASVAGLMPMPISGGQGQCSTRTISQAAIRRREPALSGATRLLCLENPTTAVAGEL